MAITTSRVHDAPAASRAVRVLVDRLWPRGVRSGDAPFDRWMKEVAPSNDLRRWYRHDPDKWREFRKRYFAELDRAPQAVAELQSLAREGDVVLVYSSRERRYNNAEALREYLEARL